MLAFIRIHNAPDVKVECKEVCVREGVRMYVDDQECQFLVVSTDNTGLYHPVVDVEVM